jgi:hypothetical protein
VSSSSISGVSLTVEIMKVQIRIFTKYIKETPVAFKINLAASLIVLVAAMYLSTGTLAPYANTLNDPASNYPLVEPKCNYLFNGDYYQFSALFRLLDGKSRSDWEYTVVLRRILYNVIAYPFMKFFEHDLGGIITNFIITIAAFFSFAFFSLRTTGLKGSIAGMWLLSMYPGITYYSGQPFLYAIIVPGCLWLYMLIWYMTRNISAGKTFACSMLMGLLFTGYDFMPVFGLAAILSLFYTGRTRMIPIALTGMILFNALWWIFVHFALKSTFLSDNSYIYISILRSYLHPQSFPLCLKLLTQIPGWLAENFLFSSFLMIPVLFLLSTILTRNRLNVTETCCAITVGLIFLINNCSPRYDYPWQMHGTWASRIYQPIFVVLLFYVVRAVQSVSIPTHGRIKNIVLITAVSFAAFGNGIVAFGPALNDPMNISSSIYWRFYKHAPPDSMKLNLDKYGRRPWGVCR